MDAVIGIVICWLLAHKSAIVYGSSEALERRRQNSVPSSLQAARARRRIAGEELTVVAGATAGRGSSVVLHFDDVFVVCLVVFR